ncbi:MAG: prepilin-type N-terminal cleavage/methylation domain-containing protein [Gallionella sp.]
MTKRNQPGFTLIEIAIVLVIIGLLLSGILKGQELINSAKVKNIAADFKNIPVFIYGYQDKFRALPGDDATIGAANTHVAGASACSPAAAAKCAVGNGVIDGAWNAHGATDESYLFWQHVRLSGFAPGATTIPGMPAIGDGYLPTNAVGGEIGIQSNANFTTITTNAAGIAGTGMTGAYVICSQGILGKFVRQLDITLDDGNSDAGSMRTLDPAAAGKSIIVGGIQDGQTYTVCMGV